MRHTRKIVAAAAALAVLVGAYAYADVGADGQTADRGLPAACRADGGRTQQIANAKLIIEFNATDDDIGVHGAFEDDGWRVLCISDPAGGPVLVVRPKSQLRRLSMAGIFFESREPPADEFSFAELRNRFPEGEYEVRGRTFDGKLLVGTATFTHDVPAPPNITSPDIYAGPNRAERNPVSERGLTVRWDRVTETVDGGPVDVSGYQVIVTDEDFEDPNGFSRPIYDVHVPPNVRSLPVPARFLEAGRVYELEVLALETSGNQTISVGFFATNGA